MDPRTSLGFVGLLAAVLVVGGAAIGQALYDGFGAVAGLAVAFLLSGWLLRTYFAHRASTAGE